jgi:hypothetical protein
MTKAGTTISVYCQATSGDSLFLFQVINFGKGKDELKFIFNDPAEHPLVVFTGGGSHLTDDTRFTSKPEITYHHDGTLLQKLIGHRVEPGTVYRNPNGQGFRRKALDQIRFWEPLIQYKVYDYQSCSKRQAKNKLVLPQHNQIFDGTAFACRIFIGSKACPSPKPNLQILSFRIDNVAVTVDLLLIVFKLDNQAERFWIGKNRIPIWSTNNIVQILDATQPFVGPERGLRSLQNRER